MLVALFIDADRDHAILILFMRQTFHPVVRSHILIFEDFSLEESFSDVENTSLMVL
jgi:hypothetical protein